MSDTDSHDSETVARQEAAQDRALGLSARARLTGSPALRRPGYPPAPRDGTDGPARSTPRKRPASPVPLRAAGTPPRPQTRPECSLFASGTVTRQLHNDPLMGLAGLRALLLHALHPVTMAAVEAQARGRWDPWQRLAPTIEYIGVTTYGSAAEAMLAGSRLRAVHARLDEITWQGQLYTAEDPNLLGWAHACLVASFLEIVTRGGLVLTPQQQDDYITEQVRLATLVGLEPDKVPHDRSSLVAYFRQVRPTLALTAPARSAALAVVFGEQPRPSPGTPVPDQPIWIDVAGLAFAALPPWARRLYALPELPGTAGLNEAAATMALRELRACLKATPAARPDPTH